MVMPGALANITLPHKLDTPSTLIKISLQSALDHLSSGLSYMSDDYEIITSIFSLLVREAMGYGDEFGNIDDAVEYALRHPNCSDKNSVYAICAETSEKIYYQITTHLPAFGTIGYKGKYSYSLGDYADVYIRLSQEITR